MKLRTALSLAVIAGIASIWLLVDHKQDASSVAPVASSPQISASTLKKPIAMPAPTGKSSPAPTSNASAPSAVQPIDPDEEPDPYPINEIRLPPEGYGDSAHSVASDLRTGADDDEDLADKLGSAYMPEDESPEDDARFTQQ